MEFIQNNILLFLLFLIGVIAIGLWIGLVKILWSLTKISVSNKPIENMLEQFTGLEPPVININAPELPTNFEVPKINVEHSIKFNKVELDNSMLCPFFESRCKKESCLSYIKVSDENFGCIKLRLEFTNQPHNVL